MNQKDIVEIVKSTHIKYKDSLIDYPFQKNIHQLSKDELIECLYDLFTKKEHDYNNFKEMLYAKFGKSIAEKFLIPYNSKLYACDLNNLDKDAMGRFFPYAEKEEIILNFKKTTIMSKLLSIIVPVYNTQDYLSRCLDSLCIPKHLEQIEVIVVIDGSPDQSITIANKYKEKYPETFVVIDKENGGHGSAINVGIELAQGKYVRILDSDDWFDEKNFPVFIERLMKENEDLVMTHCIKEYTDKRIPFEQKIKEHNTIYKVEDIIDKITDTSFAMSRCTYKTSKLREYGLVLLEKQSYEDTFLHIFPLVFLKSFACYDLVIYHYFLDRPDQSVHQQITMKHCTFWKNVIDQMCAFYLKYKDHFAPKARLYILDTIRKISDNQYVTINNLPYFEAKREIAKYHKEIKSQPIYNEIKGYKGTYYKYTPYFIFRTSKLVYNCIYKLKRLQCSKS